MNAVIDIRNKKYAVNFSQGFDLSVPLIFNGPQPNTYGVDKAKSYPYKDGQFIGDTREGGPCNFETYSFTPHCNGTHTECIGHITKERVSIISVLKDEIMPASIISVTPKKNNKDTYFPLMNTNDFVITEDVVRSKLQSVDLNFIKAVIIRTLPNSVDKKSRDYMAQAPSFFTIEAMSYLVNLGVQHLLVDLPSVDRLFDDGNLSAHNIFWQTKDKLFNLKSKHKTITEMIYVDDLIKDGSYFLNLQIAPFSSDASPSRPIIYKANEI